MSSNNSGSHHLLTFLLSALHALLYGVAIIISILLMRKLRHEEVQKVIQDHTVGEMIVIIYTWTIWEISTATLLRQEGSPASCAGKVSSLLCSLDEIQCFDYSGSGLGWALILDERQFLNWNVLEWHNPRMFHGVHLLWIVSICSLQNGSESRYFENVDWKVNLIFYYRISQNSKNWGIECYVFSPKCSIL